MEANKHDTLHGTTSWPAYNGWAPIIAMIVQAVAAGGLGYTLLGVYEINFWIALGVAAAAGLGVGILYNLIAPKMGWQKMHWIDLLFGMDPLIFP